MFRILRLEFIIQYLFYCLFLVEFRKLESLNVERCLQFTLNSSVAADLLFEIYKRAKTIWKNKTLIYGANISVNYIMNSGTKYG